MSVACQNSCSPGWLPITVSGPAQLGFRSFLRLTRKNFISCLNVLFFCPTKNGCQAGKLSQGQKNLGNAQLPPLPRVMGWPLFSAVNDILPILFSKQNPSPYFLREYIISPLIFYRLALKWQTIDLNHRVLVFHKPIYRIVRR